MKFFEATPDTFELHVVENANYRAEFTESQILQNGLQLSFGPTPIRISEIDADAADAIDNGIIFVSSAGNSGMKIDTPDGLDYDNYVVVNGFPIYYQQGTSPGSSHDDAICVGAIDSASTETKATFSNSGPGVDVYAPGRNIISSVYDGSSSLSPTIEENEGTYQKLSGTSMASPQVTGILALALENYPNMTPAEAKSFITKFAKSTITDTAGGYDDNTSLQGGDNRFAYYRKERPDNGLLIPKTVRFIRPDTGVVFPRPQIRKK
jgi:subtilisin family serine protease